MDHKAVRGETETHGLVAIEILGRLGQELFLDQFVQLFRPTRVLEAKAFGGERGDRAMQLRIDASFRVGDLHNRRRHQSGQRQVVIARLGEFAKVEFDFAEGMVASAAGHLAASTILV